MMTANEFKAWFQVFTESNEHKPPTKAQWERIKKRVSELYQTSPYPYYPSYYTAPNFGANQIGQAYHTTTANVVQNTPVITTTGQIEIETIKGAIVPA